jgi:DNA-directed RNA polymerase specialized sigma24 family protein
VNLPATNKKDWSLTADAFEQLLGLLDQDRDHAGQKYEGVRRKLMEFFEARGSESPDEQTDETINRVARKIVEGEKIESLDRYFYGVARLVWLESLRARDKAPIALDLAPTPIAPDNEEESRQRQEQEQKFRCFEVCLSKLSTEHRTLIVEYYREEEGLKIDHRRRHAEELKMSLNALRLRACRIRAELATCIDACLSRSSVYKGKDTKAKIYH